MAAAAGRAHAPTPRICCVGQYGAYRWAPRPLKAAPLGERDVNACVSLAACPFQGLKCGAVLCEAMLCLGECCAGGCSTAAFSMIMSS